MRSVEDFYNEYHNEYDMVGIIDEMGAKTNVNEFDLTKDILTLYIEKGIDGAQYTVACQRWGYGQNNDRKRD